MNRVEAETLQVQCRQLLHADPGNADAWEGRGRAEYELGHFEQARSAFDNATHLDPTRLHSWGGLGRAEFEMGSYEAAIEACDRAVAVSAIREETGILWTNKGMALLRLHRASEAMHAFDRALEIYPYQKSAWEGRVRAFLGQKRAGEALRSYLQAVRLFWRTSRQHRWL